MRVLVTRPEPGASSTTEKLRALGHDPVVLPLSRVVAITPTPVPTTLGFLATVVTSANAIRHMPVALYRRLSELPCYVVGERTAEQAVEAGFDVCTSAADVKELAGRLVRELHPGASIAYPCGRVRMPDLEERLKARDIAVTPVEVYDTLQFSYATDFIQETLSGPPIDAVLVHSVVAARQLGGMIDSELTGKYFEKTRFYCISDRVAGEVGMRESRRIAVAAKPDEASLLNLVAQE